MTIYQGFTWPPLGWCPICAKYPKPGNGRIYAGQTCPMCKETRLLAPKHKAIYLNAIKREGLSCQ